VVEEDVEAEAPNPLRPPSTPTPAPTPAPEVAPEESAASVEGDAPTPPTQREAFFKNYGVNPAVDTEDDHLSTFAVDVDTAAYTVMRRYINDGFLPPDGSVRVEEYINFFDQDYAPPEEGAFAIYLEGAPSPYGDRDDHLVRVGVQGYEIPLEARKDVVLTFVIDVSGSMEAENRLTLVKEALMLLVEGLMPDDRVGIVAYGSSARVVLKHLPVGGNYARFFDAIDSLQAGGSTYAEAGLVMGYRLAAEAFDPDAVNRVILCSDGVANVGETGPEAILAQVQDYAARGIYMTSIGVGMGNFNDTLMEQLADKGDGFYAYVDDIKEAERVFLQDLTATLAVIAKDAKIQVDFNPSIVQRYRLLGYENRDVADADFRNDAVDAGEIGMGHSVTALYELKVQPDAAKRQPALTVHVRYQDPDSGEVIEISRAIAKGDFATQFEDASPRFQLDAVVAEYAEILRSSYWAQGADLAGVAREAQRVAEYLPQDADVREFAQLAARANALIGGEVVQYTTSNALPTVVPVRGPGQSSIPPSVKVTQPSAPNLWGGIRQGIAWIVEQWQMAWQWVAAG
jgi:Ca-activated chloride channel family protein